MCACVARENQGMGPVFDVQVESSSDASSGGDSDVAKRGQRIRPHAKAKASVSTRLARYFKQAGHLAQKQNAESARPAVAKASAKRLRTVERDRAQGADFEAGSVIVAVCGSAPRTLKEWRSGVRRRWSFARKSPGLTGREFPPTVQALCANSRIFRRRRSSRVMSAI